jgi:glutamate/tyrosine decarboxylase-like PLP-dependent enzyme
MNTSPDALLPETPLCTPEEVALKSFFLGPQAENAPWVQEMVQHVFSSWVAWRRSNHPEDGLAVSEQDQQTELFQHHIRDFRSEVDELLNRFQKEVPSYSPRYMGHMLSEVSLPALVGHILTLLYNPNNISGEVSRVGLEIEQNAIGSLLSMIGMNVRRGTGHFTSGGTVANLESALRARARVYRWLSVGALAKKLDLFTGSMFDAAHMGWDRYDELHAKLSVHYGDALEPQIKSLHPLVSNPFDVSHCLQSIFGEPWRGPVMLVPGNKHYSWNKAAEVLGLSSEAFWQIEIDEAGKMDILDLKRMLAEARTAGRPVMMIVSVVGTTELGEVDPVHEIQEVVDTWQRDLDLSIWHHVDAAYGGFFATLKHDRSDKILEAPVRRALRAMGHANSVTIDPHKLGFVPYASGAILCAEKREYQHTSIHAPYIDFRPGADAGVVTLEGSRSAAGAVSTWLTSRVIGFDRLGYGRILEKTVLSARKLAHLLMEAHPMIRVNTAGDTNIVTFCLAMHGENTSVTNRRTLEVYERYNTVDSHDFYISKTTLDIESYERLLLEYGSGWDAAWDTESLVLLRMVMINPFQDTKETEINYIESYVRSLVETISAL